MKRCFHQVEVYQWSFFSNRHIFGLLFLFRWNLSSSELLLVILSELVIFLPFSFSSNWKLSIKQWSVSEHVSIEHLLKNQVSSKVSHGSCRRKKKIDQIFCPDNWIFPNIQTSHLKYLRACDGGGIHSGSCCQCGRNFWVRSELNWPGFEKLCFWNKILLYFGFFVICLWANLVKGLAIGSFWMPIASPIWKYEVLLI